MADDRTAPGEADAEGLGDLGEGQERVGRRAVVARHIE